MLKKLASLFVLIFVNAFILLAIEGLCSMVLAARHIPQAEAELFEITHTQYDPDLGWSHIPNRRFNNIYGMGTVMHINKQGFRNPKEFEPAVPVGKSRIICSGDSFTLGFGVTDGLAWCDQIQKINPAMLETVNMGQGGYGIDQAYLWYLRDGTKLQHHVHIFAFILDDFMRMDGGSFFGYGKPYLEVTDDNRLAIKNTPVPQGFPKRSYTLPDFIKRAHWLTQTSIYQLLLSTYAKFNSYEKRYEKKAVKKHLRELALKIFDDLQAYHKSNGSHLVLVLLPRRIDADNDEAREWQTWFKQETSKRGIHIIDMIDEMRGMSVQQWKEFFKYNDHYSVPGNSFVALKIFEHLMRLKLLA